MTYPPRQITLPLAPQADWSAAANMLALERLSDTRINGFTALIADEWWCSLTFNYLDMDGGLVGTLKLSRTGYAIADGCVPSLRMLDSLLQLSAILGWSRIAHSFTLGAREAHSFRGYCDGSVYDTATQRCKAERSTHSLTNRAYCRFDAALLLPSWGERFF